MQQVRKQIWILVFCLALGMLVGPSVMGSPLRPFPTDTIDPRTIARELPAAPDYHLQAAVAGGQVALTWSAVPVPEGRQLLGYHVYRSTSQEQLFDLANRVTEFAVKELSLSDYLSPGVFYYAVQAYYVDGTAALGSTPLEVRVEAGPAGGGAAPIPSSPSAGNAPASIDGNDFRVYLAVNGIPGSMVERKPFMADIYVKSFSWGEKMSIAYGAGSGAGKVNMDDLVVIKPIDRASVGLAGACAVGEHIRELRLTVCRMIRGREVPVYSIYLYDVLVSGTSVEMDQGQFFERVSFNYTRAQWTYYEVKEDGSLGASVTKTFDLKTNRMQ